MQIAKCSELHSFKVVPKRRVVAHGFTWLEKNRACGRTANASSTRLQFIHPVFLALLIEIS